MEDYFLLIFKTHISFQSVIRLSTIDICRSPRQNFLKQAKKNRWPEAAGINLKLRPALSLICAIKGKARNCCKQKSNGKEEA